VDAGDLAIDDQALEALSNSTEVGEAFAAEGLREATADSAAEEPLEPPADFPAEESLESSAAFAAEESLEPPADFRAERLAAPGSAAALDELAEPAPKSPAVYRDKDGKPLPQEVLDSLAQLSDPEPAPPQDDPKAATNNLGPYLVLPEPRNEPASSAVAAEEPSDEAWAEGLGATPDDYSWDEADESASIDLTERAEGSERREPLAEDPDLAGLSLEPEDTNFDQPNVDRFAEARPGRPARASDSSTAVIVNYLEDAEDSFFEVEGQAEALSEEEDLDIDLLDQGNVVGVLAAKPMVPVPRKAV
jgi:hypothetical protein